MALSMKHLKELGISPEGQGYRKLFCPVCNIELARQRLSVYGIITEVDHCSACGGDWIERGDLDSLVAAGIKLAKHLFGVVGAIVALMVLTVAAMWM